jgi:hypothetical protein
MPTSCCSLAGSMRLVVTSDPDDLARLDRGLDLVTV